MTNVSPRLRWTTVTVIFVVMAAALVLTLRPRPTQVQYGRVDPTHPVFNVEFPAVRAAKSRADAYSLPGELVIPPGAVLHIKGLVRAGTTCDSLIIAEMLVPRPDGTFPMCGNGATGVKLAANSDCPYELQLHYPKGTDGITIVEVRLGDEYLATARLKMTP
jgi:hypothetical protein